MRNYLSIFNKRKHFLSLGYSQEFLIDIANIKRATIYLSSKQAVKLNHTEQHKNKVVHNAGLFSLTFPYKDQVSMT